ncbi:50S ribosomal protein L11 [Candidatus Vidania fulgoroideorum]
MIEKISLNIKSQEALPKPPISSILGQRGINIMEFCKEFNSKTKKYEKGAIIPTRIFFNKKSKKISFKIKAPTVTYLIKKELKEKKEINIKTIENIYNLKKNDLNCYDFKSFLKSIIGSLKSMGIKLNEYK